MKSFEHYIPVRTLYGWGRIAELGDVAKPMGRKAIVMTFEFLAKETDCVDKALDSLKKAGIETVVFAEVEENPPVEMIRRGIELYRSQGCDLTVSIGGGSAMDSGKALATAMTNDKPLEALIGMNNVDKPAAPHIAVPTTAGTGSEATKYAIVTEGGAKKGITSELIYPTAAIVDPELTVSLPSGVTANTGLDVLAHAIEGYVSANATPVTDALALDAMTLVGKHLVAAYKEPSDREAREGMALASLLGGMVIAHAGTGLMHSMGFWLTMEHFKPHGLACAVLMPAVIEFSLEQRLEKFAMVAAALGRNLGGMDTRQAAMESIAAIRDLARDLDMELSPAAMDIPDDRLEVYVDAVMNNKRFLANVPRTPTPDQVRELYRAR